jgi:predicted P-loop ATPase
VVNSQLEWRVAGTNLAFTRLTDYDENSIFRDLLHQDQDIPLSVLHAILMSDFTPNYDPFVDYFNGLKTWDGVTDYLGQLAATVKTTDSEDWDICLRKWFVAFAVSLFVDKIINHTIIVLVGPQGVGKTRWSKSLLPEALMGYLAPGAFSADNKDTQIMMSECALIILDELENLNRKDLAAFKELITRLFFKIRRPYGRIAINMIHRASCIASVNHNQILTDTSGTRRYLCHTVTEIDYEHNVDIDGCMAQAFALYKSGFKFWFDQEDIKVLTLHNEAYMSKSVEEELIETWLRPVTAEEWNDRFKAVVPQDIKRLNATQIGMVLQEKAKLILIDSTVVKIGKVMSKLGYLRVRAGNTFAYYVRIVSQNTIEMNTRTSENTDEVMVTSLNMNQSINNLNQKYDEKEDELPF